MENHLRVCTSDQCSTKLRWTERREYNMASSETPCGIGNTPREELCVRVCNSYTTKNFRAQHPAPDAPSPRWHQKDAENLQVAEMTAGCMAWHLWLWKFLARQFSKFQSPFTLFKIIPASPLPCSQCCSRRGLDAIDTTLVTHPIPSVT